MRPILAIFLTVTGFVFCDGAMAISTARNCHDHYTAGQTQSGVYSIRPTPEGPAIEVACHMENGQGWTLIARSSITGQGPLWELDQHLDLESHGRLTDELIVSLMKISTPGNNMRVTVNGQERTYSFSLTIGNWEKGSYQTTAGYCQGYAENGSANIPTFFIDHHEWRFINGNMAGSIGYADSWGFHVDLCGHNSAEACGETADTVECFDHLTGELWIL